jgi:tetratricopeptide (TPR) repeat protein
MLDNVVPSSGILDDNPNISKFEKYLAVINDCKDLVLDNHTLGLIHWKIFQDNKIALDYFISGMQKRDEKAEDCFTDGLKITKNLQFWVDCGLKNFPTQKYAVLYAAAKETKNLHFAEQSLLEFNINGSKKSNCHMFNNIGKCHILRLVGKCHFKTKSYKIAFDYWKLTLSSIGVFNSFAFRSYAFRIYKDIILLCIRYLKSTNEAQVYISELMIRLDDLMLSSSEDSDIAHWQAKCMQDYVSTSQWVSILNHHSQFLKMIRRSAHPKLESFANECQCIAHFHQFNFQESLTYGLKVQESKRSLRYIGKCFMKISQFEKAFEYFTKYVQIERNCIILLEFALLYSEIDSNYYDLEKSKQFYLEANEKKVHIRGKLSMEESVLFEQVLTRDKKRKRE